MVFAGNDASEIPQKRRSLLHGTLDDGLTRTTRAGKRCKVHSIVVLLLELLNNDEALSFRRCGFRAITPKAGRLLRLNR